MSLLAISSGRAHAWWCFVGLFCIIPCTDSFVKVDLRTVSFDIPPQEVHNSIYAILHSSLYCTPTVKPTTQSVIQSYNAQQRCKVV